jgi:hypothetical protein
MQEESLRETAQRLSELLTPGDLDHTLSQVTRAAVEVLPDVTSASITIRHADGTLDTVGQTDDVLLVVDAAQYQLQEGPCYLAAEDTVHVTSPDIGNDERFPRYGEVAVAAGVRAQAGLRLFETPKTRGALNLYSDKVGTFADLTTTEELFTHHAATAISYAREVTNLKEAVNTRTSIGQAVGIVMERYELTDHRAFAFLLRMSQHRNVKLRLIAQEIVAATEHQGDQP